MDGAAIWLTKLCDVYNVKTLCTTWIKSTYSTLMLDISLIFYSHCFHVQLMLYFCIPLQSWLTRTDILINIKRQNLYTFFAVLLWTSTDHSCWNRFGLRFVHSLEKECNFKLYIHIALHEMFGVPAPHANLCTSDALLFTYLLSFWPTSDALWPVTLRF